MTDFQKVDAGGKRASVIGWGSPWYSSAYCGGYCPFATSLFSAVRSKGVIPFLSWSSTGSPGDSSFADAQIAAGSQDSYIRQWAEAAKAWGHPFFLRFDWEMNGSWFAWGVGHNGATAGDFVAMWRHVHDIFTSVGATNATWVWCPNIVSRIWHGVPFGSVYPGKAYVDWTCLSGYNTNTPWTSFANVYGPGYAQITGSVAPSKPLILGELGSTESGGSKARWISGMFSALSTGFPRIRGILWNEVPLPGFGFRNTDWPIESSRSSKAAFARGIRSSMYKANVYSNLNKRPIPPPS